jgi:tripartite-type tricarboxylate transporter receptor subunit TctC
MAAVIKVLLAGLVSLLVLSSSAGAAKRVALVIGNSAYKHAGELANPKNDATDVAAALRNSGFQVLDAFDLDKPSFDRKIRDFVIALAGAEAGLFFYAGHGLQVAGKNYLVPIDAELTTSDALEFEMVQLDTIHRIMERQSNTNIIFLDACRNNPLARNLSRAMGTRSAEIGRGLAAVESGVGTLISFSTQPGNVALDGTGRNSPFAGALARRITSSSDDLSALLIDVRNDVRKETENKQVPWEHSALTGRFYFNAAPKTAASAAPSPPDPPASEVAQMWRLIENSEDPAVFEAFRRQFGKANPVYDQLAAGRIASLERARAQQQAAKQPAAPPAKAPANVAANVPAPAPRASSGAAWPTRPVTLVVPFAPGGPTDVAGRTIAQVLAELLGQPFVVENRPGGGGAVGTGLVAKAPADGGQFMIGNLGTHVLNQLVVANIGYDAATDFAPVGLIAEAPFLVAARNTLQASDLASLVLAAKKSKLKFASAGAGTASQLACLMLNNAAGITSDHVPYRGFTPGLTDLIAGKVDYICESASVLLPQIQAGSIRALAVLDARRLPSLPAVATVAEARVPRVEATSWIALFGPKGTPPDVVAKLNDALLAAMRKPDVRKRLEELGGPLVAPERATPAYLAQFVRSELQKWAAPAKASGAAQ